MFHDRGGALPPARFPRISQRSPQACQECTRRKVRCDKQIPCSRCSRLKKPCSREIVYTTKVLGQSTGRADELHFLEELSQLLASGASPSDARDAVRTRVASIQNAAQSPLSGHLRDSSRSEAGLASDAGAGAGAGADADVDAEVDAVAVTATDPAAPVPQTSSSSAPIAAADATSVNAIRALQSQVWCRQSNFCYPHRRECKCQHYRSYSELASINSDLGSSLLKWTYYEPDTDIFLTTQAARQVVDFHVRQLWWHHNALSSRTFFDQCDRFWASGTIVHPLWLALYLSILGSTLWTLANSPKQALELGIEIDNSLMGMQYKEMMRILYAEDYLDNPSMFTIQAAIIATRFAHNIGFSSSVTSLLNSVIGMAQSMGLHHISSPQHSADLPTPTQSRALWHESVEIEAGRRTWWQLVIQDHFAIPFTESHLIQPSQYSTALPLNCNDDDLIPQDDRIITTSSYTRCIAKECVLMLRLLDCFAESPSTHPALHHYYIRVLRLDQEMRSTIAKFPTSLIGDKPASESADVANAVWLPTARRTLAISAADKIIMIHRPLMFRALRTPDLPKTRMICLSAAVTILREHERDAAEGRETVAIWTQTAFCTSAVTVLGLELLYGPIRNSPHTAEYRQLLSGTSHTLQKRPVDSMAVRCIHLIDVFLAADAEATRLSVDGRHSAQRKHTEYVDELVQSQRIVTNFLSSSQIRRATDLSEQVSEAIPLQYGTSTFASLGEDDFETWYNGLFAPLDS